MIFSRFHKKRFYFGLLAEMMKHKACSGCGSLMDVEQLVGCNWALKGSLRDAIGAMVKSER